MSKTEQKFGSAALVGLPNSGKSTLTNALVGSKVSIVSKKVQTTRCRITGIFMQDQAQIVLVDTPGVFAPVKTMERAMVQAAFDALEETDIIMHIVDTPTKNVLEKNKSLIEKMPREKKVFLVLNKIDQIKRDELLDISQRFNDFYPYAATFMISALKENGLDALKKAIADEMPQAEWGFDPDNLTDMPMRFMAAEITREKIFQQLHDELPYSIFVETENWETFDNGSARIMQVITVEKDSQKAIVLGKGGSQIKKIGETARRDMEDVFGFPVHVKLFVKTEKTWAEQAENFHKMGLNFKK